MIAFIPFSTGPQQQQKFVPLLGLEDREAAQLGPAKAVCQEREEN